MSVTIAFIQQKRKMNRSKSVRSVLLIVSKRFNSYPKQKQRTNRRKQVIVRRRSLKDINKSDKKESFDWQSSFTAVNKRFAELKQEDQEAMLFTWMQLSEENQKQFLYVLIEDHGVDTLQKFIKET